MAVGGSCLRLHARFRGVTALPGINEAGTAKASPPWTLPTNIELFLVNTTDFIERSMMLG